MTYLVCWMGIFDRSWLKPRQVLEIVSTLPDEVRQIVYLRLCS